MQKRDWLTLFSLPVSLAVNIGVMNLLPLPALDGGRILFVLIEMIFRKPIPRDKEGYVHFIGFFAFNRTNVICNLERYCETAVRIFRVAADNNLNLLQQQAVRDFLIRRLIDYMLFIFFKKLFMTLILPPILMYDNNAEQQNVTQNNKFIFLLIIIRNQIPYRFLL